MKKLIFAVIVLIYAVNLYSASEESVRKFNFNYQNELRNEIKKRDQTVLKLKERIRERISVVKDLKSRSKIKLRDTLYVAYAAHEMGYDQLSNAAFREFKNDIREYFKNNADLSNQEKSKYLRQCGQFQFEIIQDLTGSKVYFEEAIVLNPEDKKVQNYLDLITKRINLREKYAAKGIN